MPGRTQLTPAPWRLAVGESAVLSRTIHGAEVFGVDVDDRTRCGHYRGPRDIIALRFRCCGRWYPCIDCHRELAGHAAEAWPLSERDSLAVLCGACGHRLTVREYLNCSSVCPSCAASFNPGCALHHHFYFEME